MRKRRVRRGASISVERPQINRPLKRPAKKRRFPIKFVAGILLIFALAYFSWWILNIRTIELSNTQFRSDVESEINKVMSNPPWQRNLFWFPSATAESALKRNLSDKIAEVKISKKWWPPSLVVDVTDRTAVVSWQSGDTIFGIDQKGVVTGHLSPESGLPEIIDEANLPLSPGTQIARASFIDFILQLDVKLPEIAGLSFERGRVVETTNDIYVDTNQRYYLRLDTTGDLEVQLSNLKKLLDKNIKPSVYFDLRLPHKAYYR